MVGANFARRKGIIEPLGTGIGASVPSVSSLPVKLVIPKTSGQGYRTAIDKLYASLRSGNTGSVQYTKLDLQYYLMNLRLALFMTRILRRAYGVIKKYDLFDKTLPISIFKAMGLDYDTFAANSADLRNQLNFASVRLHTVMPGKTDLLERTAWLADNVFKDSNDAKAQLYLFTSAYYQEYYDWTNNSITDISGFTNFSNNSTATGTQYTAAMGIYLNVLEKMLASDKVQIIAADILKAYGTDQIKYFENIDENYTVDYVYSEEVLTQIQNARILHGTRSSTAAQDTRITTTTSGNYLTTDAYFAYPSGVDPVNVLGVVGHKQFINMYKNDISNLDLLGATRFCWTVDVDSSIGTRFHLITFGTEIIVDWNIVNDDGGAGYAYNLQVIPLYTFLDTLDTISSNSGMYNTLVYADWSSFDWAPMIIPTSITAYNSSGTLIHLPACLPVWDYNNYALVEPSQLDTYHDIVTMSILYVPSLVKNINLIAIK